MKLKDMIEAVTCPNHKIAMKRVSGIHGPYWRCPAWGCDQKANTLGEIVKPRRDEEDEPDGDATGFKKRRWEE